MSITKVPIVPLGARVRVDAARAEPTAAVAELEAEGEILIA